MATQTDMSSANAKSTERLAALVARLTTEDMKRSLGANWTVGFALAHLAFWDAAKSPPSDDSPTESRFPPRTWRPMLR